MNIIDLLALPFVQRAVIGGVIVGLLAAVLGVFVVLRKQSFLTEAVSHASLAGVAAALLLSFEPVTLAILVAVLLATLITYFNRKVALSADSLIGIFFSIFFAVGIVLINLSPEYQPEVMTYLFGSILAVSWNDLIYAFIIATVLGLVIARLYKQLLYFTFDPMSAYIRGVRVEMIEYILNILTAVAVVVSVKVVGVILVTALFIIPASSAKLLARSFKNMIPISALLSVVSVLLGLLLSVVTNLPPGALIVLVSGMIFLLLSLMQGLSHTFIRSKNPS
jgi:zinc transport system permease protein